MTVPGCVAGLTLVIRAFIRPRAFALVEDPASFIHTSVLLAQRAEIMRVPREADGPDLDVLRLLCERYRPAMFLLTSVLHNPTGSSISLHKARKLIEIAAEFDMMLVDDASYADLSPSSGGRPVVPLAVLDQLDHVIHVGGSSHVLAPEVGAGFIVANEARMKLLRLFRPVQGLGNMLTQERVLYRFLSDGLYRRRCERIRTALAQRATTLRHALAAASCTVARRAGNVPVGRAGAGAKRDRGRADDAEARFPDRAGIAFLAGEERQCLYALQRHDDDAPCDRNAGGLPAGVAGRGCGAPVTEPPAR